MDVAVDIDVSYSLIIGPLNWRVECSPMGRGDRGSISGQVLPKTKKNVLDTFLLDTQHYEV